MLSENKKTYQITFYVEFGIVSDRILQDLMKFGIGTRSHTKIFVLPTTFILGGQCHDKNESESTLSLTGTMTTNESLSHNVKNKIHGVESNDLTSSRKIRKRISVSNFKKSVQARLMVHQVVASIRASTVLSFDFVLLICLASMLAALGLLENSTVIIVASMLVSPLMNPILGIVFGLSVREHSLWRRGLRNELIGLIICISCGFILGLLTTFAETKWGSSASFPTLEMKSRGDVKRLWVGVLIALPSGAGVALSVLGGNTGSLVGVAISGSGFSNNYNNRNGRENSGGSYSGQRDNNYGRRDYEPHRPYHSHVGGQSSDAVGHDWNIPLPPNANLESLQASLLPPAVNCGLLFAYSLLGSSLSSIARVHPSSLNDTKKEYNANLTCKKYINNDYQPLYTCNLAREAAALAGCSLLLTIVNIICIIIMALFILRIKEVVPLHQPNKDIAKFFHHDVKVARDYNKTINEDDLEKDNLSTLTVQQSHLAKSIINRWKKVKSITSHNNQQNQEIQQSSSINNDLELNNTRNNNVLNIDTESRRKLFRLKTFAKEYDLDVLNKNDYDLLNSNSREKIRLLINDLIDIYQDIPTVCADLFHLQPCNIQTSTAKEHMSFYQEILELLPPKWYQLFIREQERRRMISWSSPLNRTYSLRVPQFATFRKLSSESNVSSETERQKMGVDYRRRSSVPEISLRASEIHQDTEIPVEGKRSSITKLVTTT
ncbi:unnamed protein product [Rotaria sp. Silwood1]|nr:unnamed protein product [Rotaria sp. Silwood1]